MRKKHLKLIGLSIFVIGIFFLLNFKLDITGGVIGNSAVSSTFNSILGIALMLVSITLFTLADNASDLEKTLESTERRAERFKELKEAFSKGEYTLKGGFEGNDFISLKDGGYTLCFENLKIPQDLVDEATNILKEKDELGFSFFKSPGEEERKQNKSKFVEYFKKCENVERRLYKILSNYKEKHF